MQKEIVVLNADQNQTGDLYDMLKEQNYSITQMKSLQSLERHIKDNVCPMIIMDIDSVSVTNQAISQLALITPETYFLCLSKDRVHPDLKEALSRYIYASIKKPIDPDEFFYLVESIYK